MIFALGELAERVGGEVQGSPARQLDGVRTLSEAGPTHLSFLTSSSYLEQAVASAAGALLVGRDAQLPGRDLLRCAQPQLALAAILRLYHPVAARRPRRPSDCGRRRGVPGRGLRRARVPMSCSAAG